MEPPPNYKNTIKKSIQVRSKCSKETSNHGSDISVFAPSEHNSQKKLVQNSDKSISDDHCFWVMKNSSFSRRINSGSV